VQQQQQQQQQQQGSTALASAAKHTKHGSSSSAGGWSDFTPPGTAGGAAAAGAAAAAGDVDDDTLRPWDTFNYETALQQQALQQQDEELGHIAVHVDRIKQQGLMMNEELEQQVRLAVTSAGAGAGAGAAANRLCDCLLQQSLLLRGLEDHTDTTFCYVVHLAKLLLLLLLFRHIARGLLPACLIRLFH
jgi:hypothetical protein